MRYKIVLLLAALLLTSCTINPGQTSEPADIPPDTAVTSPPLDDLPTNKPMENPFAPQPNDAKLTRGIVFIEESGLLIRESYPPQISLGLSGNLPNPCHQLRAEIGNPSSENKIHVNVYTVVDPNRMCTEVLKPFQENIDLGTFPSGHYSVWLNGELAGEFDS